ncbi:MAG: hypothetical protein ACLP1X_27085 [Polyangiaceae bacterium]
METAIKVTPDEANHADWAIGGMQDAGTDFNYEEEDIPFLRGSELIFQTSSNAAAEDFLFRVEDQLKDMIYDEYGYGDAFRPKLLPQGAKELRASKSLARKVRARFPNTEKNPMRRYHRRNEMTDPKGRTLTLSGTECDEHMMPWIFGAFAVGGLLSAIVFYKWGYSNGSAAPATSAVTSTSGT